ncbi:alpha/beta hydrolase [Alkalihalobacillus sp. MEB130]|uniref:alpha/beta fold hydrolase n=1 Tax=Alkalihalobacillus sp. MEB130 TaxID=2976704 RepID=UPI0028E0231F|nr:alpha/beta hydrolase [Alkalihalobacillus sp. MEB130]MDT8860243.1 alpha/beta hydrolase [Alkalihalobacillus sp. MEB130]
MLFYKIIKKNTHKEWVVLLHGLGGSSNIWFKQLRAFKKEFNILMVDLRGHGGSRHLSGEFSEYDWELVSRDIIAVLRENKISKAHFVGISLGTLLIRKINLLRPDMVKSMILGGSITKFNKRGRFLIKIGHIMKSKVPYMWLYKFFAWILMPKRNHYDSRMMFVKEAKNLSQEEFIKWFDLTSHIDNLYDDYYKETPNTPILYLMGEEDHMFINEVNRCMKQEKMSELVIIEKTGHVCNVDASERFNEMAVRFIKKQSSFIDTTERIKEHLNNH